MGQVEILGGGKREIHVNLDRNKLIAPDIPAASVVNALQSRWASTRPSRRAHRWASLLSAEP